MTTQQAEDDDGEAFMRSVTWFWEDLLSRHPGFIWRGEYRWFRSPNVIPIERAGGWKWRDALPRRR